MSAIKNGKAQYEKRVLYGNEVHLVTLKKYTYFTGEGNLPNTKKYNVNVIVAPTKQDAMNELQATIQDLETILKRLRHEQEIVESNGSTWITHGNVYSPWYECKRCHKNYNEPSNYCPNCGIFTGK